MRPAIAVDGELRDRWEERAATLEHECGIERAWADALAWIIIMPPPAEVWPERWARIVSAAVEFVEAHGPSAIATGWSVDALLGVRGFGDSIAEDAVLWRLERAEATGIEPRGAILMRGPGVRFSVLKPAS